MAFEYIPIGALAWREIINDNFSIAAIKSDTVQYDDLMSLNMDIVYGDNTVGPVLTDRSTGTKYRLYVDNGVLNIEAV